MEVGDLLRMLRTLIVMGLGAGPLLLAADLDLPKIQVEHTERMDFPAGGTLRLSNSLGEITIEGWDQPGVEITTFKSTKTEYRAGERDKAAQDLAQLRIEAERQGDQVVITTKFPRRRGVPRSWLVGAAARVDVQYQIRVPRSARIIVDHNAGEVHVEDVAGDIHATTLQGVLLIHLPERGQYAIDAKTTLGSLVSDFPGVEKRVRLLGHRVVENTPAASQRIYLRSGYGDILILRRQAPPTPASLAQETK
jgi:hypothetical protein